MEEVDSTSGDSDKICEAIQEPAARTSVIAAVHASMRIVELLTCLDVSARALCLYGNHPLVCRLPKGMAGPVLGRVYVKDE